MPASLLYSAEGSEGQLLGVIRELKLGSWALFLSIFADEMGEPRKSRTEAVEERNGVETGLHVSSSQRNLLNRKRQASR